MSKITIVVEDSIVGINGVFRKVTLPNLGNVRAVQWNGTTGHVEYNNGTPNLTLTSIADYVFVEELWANSATGPQSPSPISDPAAKIVSMRQARLALLQFGVLASVNTAIASGSEEDKITWEYATEVNSLSPLVTNMKAFLGLTDAQLDGLFMLAKTL